MRGNAAAGLLMALVLGGAVTHARDPHTASPAERNQARSLANEGLARFRDGEYRDAIEKFEAAEAIVHAPPHLLYIARAEARLRRLVAARDTYRRIVDEELPKGAPKAFTEARADAERELAELEPRIPRLAIALDGAPRERIRVTVDGREITELELPLDPGEHEVSAEGEGHRSATARVTLAESAVERLALRLEPLEPAEPGGEPTEVPLGPVLLMAGGTAVLVAGAVTGGLALARANELRERCPTNPCPTANQPLEDEATTFATVSTATLVIGGVAAAAGLGWLIFELTADDAADAAVVPLFGPGAAGVAGRF